MITGASCADACARLPCASDVNRMMRLCRVILVKTLDVTCRQWRWLAWPGPTRRGASVVAFAEQPSAAAAAAEPPARSRPGRADLRKASPRCCEWLCQSSGGAASSAKQGLPRGQPPRVERGPGALVCPRACAESDSCPCVVRVWLSTGLVRWRPRWRRAATPACRCCDGSSLGGHARAPVWPRVCAACACMCS